MRQKSQLMDSAAVGRALTRISHEIIEHNKGTDGVCLVGIKRRGEPLAKIIAENIKKIENVDVEYGSVDIKFYRDDLSQYYIDPEIRDSKLPFDVNDKHIVLIDDVLCTGRTVRAAIDAIIKHGRPKTIQLAVLIDRGHRELPIRADYVGKNVPTSKTEVIEVRVPEIDNETGVYLMEID